MFLSFLYKFRYNGKGVVQFEWHRDTGRLPDPASMGCHQSGENAAFEASQLDRKER